MAGRPGDAAAGVSARTERRERAVADQRRAKVGAVGWDSASGAVLTHSATAPMDQSLTQYAATSAISASVRVSFFLCLVLPATTFLIALSRAAAS